MNPILQAMLLESIPTILAVIVFPFLAGLAAWLLAKLPGPIREALTSATHQRDMQLLLGVLGRGVQAYLGSRTRSSVVPSIAVAEAVAYARQAIPETITKLQPPPETLAKMATALLEDALTRRALAENSAALSFMGQPVRPPQ